MIEQKNWDLLSWHKSVNSANNEKFSHFQLRTPLFILASLAKPRQSIYSCICLTLAIVDLEMVLRELLGPVDLSGAQALRIYETTEVIVVRKDENLMLAAFQVVVPSLEWLNNG